MDKMPLKTKVSLTFEELSLLTDCLSESVDPQIQRLNDKLHRAMWRVYKREEQDKYNE